VPENTETLTLEHDYAATPAELFAAWTRIDLLTQWFGCAPNVLWNVHTWEARAGGAIHVSLAFDEKPPFVVHGEFLVVDPPHHLRYRWRDDEIVDVTIEPNGTGSHMRLVHTFPAGQELRPILAGGWSAGIEQLAHVRSRESEHAS
jgi:uncharacterized protein YndB with AHSA1/START domain